VHKLKIKKAIKMKKSILILMMVTTGFFCAAQSSTDSVYTGKSSQDSVYTGKSAQDSVYTGKSTQDSAYTGSLDSTKNVQGPKPSAKHNQNNFHTTYEYAESNGTRLVIQNSFPKSGTNYTDPNGKKYVYAVFWTQIINETFDPLELTIDFPLDSFEIPSSSGNYMRLLLPSDTMTIDKEPLYDYGLTIKSFLDNNRHQSSSLKRTIPPKGSSTFYVVALSNKGVGGTIRAGLSLKEQDLFYRVNDKEIRCGKINLKNLILKK
jgi:hypothetical protein